MLKLVAYSQAKKTKGCAVTYRAGARSCFGTCPSQCSLNPEPRESTGTIDRRYFNALLAAVPRRGHSFTYTHFEPGLWMEDYHRRLGSGEPCTVVNYSTESATDAIQAVRDGLSVAMALPKGSERRVAHLGGIRVVRCPAEYQAHVNCANCGGPGGPLCARADRDYVVGFYAHGSGAKHVSRPTRGGCYAAHGNVRLHWEDTVGVPRFSEATAITAFAEDLPRHTVLRHHVAGDIGAE